MTTGYKTHIDRKKYNEIVERISKIDREMNERGEKVAQEWRDAYPTLVSEEFWHKFLSMGVEGDDEIHIGELE